jgi:hypothetical protein
MPARNDDIETIARLTAELTTRRVADEQITPLRKDVATLVSEVRVLNVRIVGNGTPGLIQRMEKLEARESAGSSFRDRIYGARWAIVTLCSIEGGLIAATAALWHLFHI